MKRLILVIGLSISGCTTPENSTSTQVTSPPTLAEMIRRPKGTIWNGTNFRQANANTSCFPQKLKKQIKKLIDVIGPIEITSGHRPRAGNSLHAKCLAVDFRPLMVSNKKALEVMRSMPGVGGIGSYRRSDILHMDIGSRREWYR
jgi:uncharacterized protein YcbK (DUF882 family)